jgi:adenine phosphoribosyltransferase
VNLKAYVRDIPDFPIKGVLFRDISPLLADPVAFDSALEQLVKPFDLRGVSAFVGIESRGFILAAALAAKFHKGFVPLRKAGKLPPPFISSSYKLEYGEATLEMRAGSGKVILVDDVLATGGTLEASIGLCEKSGYEISGVAVLINLKGLNNLKYKGEPVHSVLEY